MKSKQSLGLLVALLTVIGLLLTAGQTSHAATLSDVTAGLITGNSRVPNEGGDSGAQSFLGVGSQLSTTVKADGLKPFGSDSRISTSTTQISVTYQGTLTTKSGTSTGKPGNFMTYYFDLLDRNGNSFTKPSQVTSIGFKSTSLTINQTVTFDVDLKDLEDRGPIYIAYCFTTDLSSHVNKYYSSRVGYSLNPTITTSPVTTAATKVSGTGTAGDKITNSVTGDSTRVGDDGKWTLDLTGGGLKNTSTLTVRESNEFGDYGTAFTFVTAPSVTISADQTSLNLSSSDVDDLQGMSDSDFADWVIKKANITGKSKTASDTVTVKTDTTGLADALKKVAANDSMTIDFYATNGTSKSATQTITLVKPGTVKFGTVSSNIDFGSHGVPTASTLFGPTTGWDVNVNDTRETGSKWYLYATATSLTSGTHTMPGYVMYRDANGQTSDLTKSTLIDSGERGASADTSVTSDWTTDPKATDKAGIFLDVEPGVYADSSIKYSGAVNWTLNDVPTS